MTLHDDPYSVLGLMRDASRAETDQRYRLLAERLAAEAEYDPAALAQLRAVNAAYQQLTAGAPAPGAAPLAPAGAPRPGAPRVVLQHSAPPAPPRAAAARGSRLPRRLGAVLFGVLLVAGGEYARHAKAHKAMSGSRAVAVAYAGAIVAFEHSHEGKPPLLSTSDWPDKLGGPVDAAGTPYLPEVPAYAREHPFDVIQTRSRSGDFASPESANVPVTSTTSGWVVQYVPYGRTYSLLKKEYVYNGYLVLVDVPYSAKGRGSVLDPLPLYCEAWGDPVQVTCK